MQSFALDEEDEYWRIGKLLEVFRICVPQIIILIIKFPLIQRIN